MKNLLIAAALVLFTVQPALAAKSAYQICVETCLAWEDRASSYDIRRCIAEYCKKYLVEDIIKKANYPIEGETCENQNVDEI